MGLDFLDIMFRLEHAFGIYLNTDDFQPPLESGSKTPRSWTKVGDLYEIVLEKRRQDTSRRSSVSLEDKALDEVRRALAAVLEVRQEQIGRDDSLAKLIPERVRNKLWRRLKKELRMKLLSPRPPRVWYRLIWWTGFSAITLVSFSAILLIVPHTLESIASFLVGLLACILVSMAISSIFTGLLLSSPIWHIVEFPQGLQTVGDLAQSVLALNRKHFVELCESDPEDDIWESLRFIIADALAVDPEQVTKEADLLKDLGAA